MLQGHDFDTISPSAISLILMKGYTNLPYARQTSELIQKISSKFVPEQLDKFTFLARTVHFEYRYLSINSLMQDLDISNFLEISSGYSFRGLDTIQKSKVNYIDTDLENVIKLKEKIMVSLPQKPAQGKLKLMPLNALNREQFEKTAASMPAGKIAIINEGLLMYLDDTEKEYLCQTIREILKSRGGYWITADIYLQNKINNYNFKIDQHTQKFLEHHKIEEKRFKSLEDAKHFFNKMGFVIDKEADVNINELSTIDQLLQHAQPEQLKVFQNEGKISTTWRLKLSD